MAAITSGGTSHLVSYTYDPNGNLTGRSLANSTSTAYAYDPANRLLSLAHQKNGVSFDSIGYAYNSVGDRTSRSEALLSGSAATDAYAYDAIDQLTGVSYATGRNVNYAYDPAGNRSSVTDSGTAASYTANNLIQYTAIGGASPTYDANGNLSASGPWTYTYDAQNRLIAAVSGSSALTATFSYDARDRCVSRAINGAATYYAYDRWNLIQEDTPAGAETTRYIHGSRVDEMVALITGSATAYYHQDVLGSTVSLTDPNGNLLETCSYDIYGLPAFKDPLGNPLSASSVGNRFLFTGREWLPAVNLFDYRNRMYSQDQGRFLQPDPIRLASISRDPLASSPPFLGLDQTQLSPSLRIGERLVGPNLYDYVFNQPIEYTDPTGLLGDGGGWCEAMIENYNYQDRKSTQAWNKMWNREKDIQKQQDCNHKNLNPATSTDPTLHQLYEQWEATVQIVSDIWGDLKAAGCL
jgi:RHS repeat-associated protein